MKDRMLNVLQRVGRSFMLPIAILPVAGLSLKSRVTQQSQYDHLPMDCNGFWVKEHSSI